MKIFPHVLLAGAILTGMASCTKVIDIDLNSADPQVVIEGLVTDQQQPFAVRITQTVNYNQNNNMPPISGAEVLIKDLTNGITDTLKETQPGYYTSAVKAGQNGHSYQLYVKTGDKVFTAESTMPQRVSFDSVYVETSSAFGGTQYLIFPVFTDPAGIKNYYRFLMFYKGRRQNFETRDDRFTDGRPNGRPIFPDGFDEPEKGDTVRVEMQCLDEQVHKYFESFEQASGSAGSPANPVSNIKGGALGYFSAYTTESRKVVLP